MYSAIMYCFIREHQLNQNHVGFIRSTWQVLKKSFTVMKRSRKSAHRCALYSNVNGVDSVERVTLVPSLNET